MKYPIQPEGIEKKFWNRGIFRNQFICQILIELSQNNDAWVQITISQIF